MSSNFPSSIDSFINPNYTKVNGVDYVKAEHVNDLQDAIRNTQIVMAGAGIGLGAGSNYYVPTSASVKNAIEILDGAIKTRQTAFETHLNSVMPTDPYQHHSNVIQVTAIGNLNSTRAQQAFEELQADIDAIMSGGYVEGFTLDDRYILKSGSASVTGSLSVQNNLTVLQNATFGSTLSNVVSMSGSLNVGKDAVVFGNFEVGGNLTMPDTSKIGSKNHFEYSNLSFLSTGVNLKSIRDITLVIDSDDSVDGQATTSKFELQNGIGSPIFAVDEDGIMTVLSKIATSFAELDSHLLIGSSVQTRLEHNKMSVENGSFLLQLDSNNNDLESVFVITKDGDLGTLNTSTNIVLKADQSSVISGNQILKRGVQEQGYFGMKFYSDNAGGKFHGIGVNFKSKMLSVPSSVTLSIDPLKSSNYNNVTITDLNEYGFFVECDSLTVGHVELKGTYTTVGN